MSVDLNILKRRLREDAGQYISNYWATKISELIVEVERLRQSNKPPPHKKGD